MQRPHTMVNGRGVPPLIQNTHRAVCGITIALTIASTLPACSTTATRTTDTLDSRFAGPCLRLNVAWPKAESTLHVVRCDVPDRRGPPLQYAYTAVAVEPSTVPLVVTGIPDSGWRMITKLWADATSADVLRTMGYVIELAEIQLGFNGTASSLEALVETNSDAQVFELGAQVPTAWRAVEQRRALISDDEASVTAFFGPEYFSHAVLEQVSVGYTTLPVADLGSTAIGVVTLDRDHRSERIFWRLPK